MTRPWSNPRQPAAEVDALFYDRWSPRALSSTPLTDGEISALFEAARWAPSCFNDQPWLFRYAVTAEDRERFALPLAPRNLLWAKEAPLLVYVLARRHFAHNQRENRHAAFDAGAAWLSLALQARRLGLFAHAMAGFDGARAAEVLAVDESRYQILAAIAVGRYGDPAALSEELREGEKRNGRKPLKEVAVEG